MEAWRKGTGLARTPLRDTDPSWVGAYRLQARLGAGGMGVVYLATSQDGRSVALKALRPEMAGDAEFRKRFSREVTALRRVSGVCTVRVIDADTTAARPYLVTEYAEGPSLSEYIEARGPLDPQMLYGLATGLAEALTAIHAAGIVHRDLKPSNILLTPDGPKVIDFGIAQVMEATAVTRAGMTVGSAGFMAPEQIMGRAGTAADLFSWAVTIAYAASGQAPFGTGTSEAILYRILHAEPDIAAVPDLLRPQVTAALSKDPHDRPTAVDLLSQLTHTAAALPAASYDNPTQTILAQTWRPPTNPQDRGPAQAPQPTPQRTPQDAAASWAAPTGQTPGRGASSWTVPASDAPSRSAPPPRTPSSGWPAQPESATAAGHRGGGRRRSALIMTVLVVAIVLGAGGTALAFALSGNHSSNSGNNAGAGGSHSTSAPATSPATGNGDTFGSAPASSPAATAPASAATSATQSATPSTGTLPVLVAGSYSGMQPTEIGYSGDSTNVVTSITWSSWTATSATGTGTSDIDNCVPSCAAASPDPVTTTITLSDPVGGHFTQMSETRNGSTTNYSYPTAWAQSAS
jgi:serine/threonine protein kinase